MNGSNGAKDNCATVMSYSRLSLESEAQNGQLLGNVTGIRHHPNGLVTFSSSSNVFGQPIYANTRGQVPVMPIKPMMNSRNNSSNNFGSSNHLQKMIGENTTPRFMAQNSSTLEV